MKGTKNVQKKHELEEKTQPWPVIISADNLGAPVEDTRTGCTTAQDRQQRP